MTQQPLDPRGMKIRRAEAINRWTLDKWSSAITFYETYNMAWRNETEISSTTEASRFPRNIYDTDLRIISPTETERCLGFPDNWTRSDEADIDTRARQNRRRNAVVNAFAVPVITRILVALCVCLEAPKAPAMSLWLDPSLPAPYYPSPSKSANRSLSNHNATPDAKFSNTSEHATGRADAAVACGLENRRKIVSVYTAAR